MLAAVVMANGEVLEQDALKTRTGFARDDIQRVG